jgi:hypothetical protein
MIAKTFTALYRFLVLVGLGYALGGFTAIAAWYKFDQLKKETKDDPAYSDLS